MFLKQLEMSHDLNQMRADERERKQIKRGDAKPGRLKAYEKIFTEATGPAYSFHAEKYWFSLGVSSKMKKSIYFPLVYGNNTFSSDLFTNYAQNIRFSLRINPVNRLGLHARLNS